MKCLKSTVTDMSIASKAYHSLDENEEDTFGPTVSLLSSSISAAGLNPLGAISEASIKLRGPVLQATLVSVRNEDFWTYTLLVRGTPAISVSHDCLLVEDRVAPKHTAGEQLQGENANHPTHNSASETIVRRAQCGDKPMEFKIAVLCLGIATYGSWMSGLVLCASKANEGKLERLGTFSAGTEPFQVARMEEVDVC